MLTSTCVCSLQREPGPDMAVHFTLVCLSTLFLWSIACVSCSHSDPVDCCLDVSPRRIPFGVLKGFQIQTLEDGCPIEAVVFITKGGVSLCAPPNQTWVHRWINRLKKLAHNVNRKPVDY